MYKALHKMLREKQRLLGGIVLSKVFVYMINAIQKARVEFKEESTTKDRD